MTTNGKYPVTNDSNRIQTKVNALHVLDTSGISSFSHAILQSIMHRHDLCIIIRGKLFGAFLKVVQNFRGRLYSNTQEF